MANISITREMKQKIYDAEFLLLERTLTNFPEKYKEIISPSFNEVDGVKMCVVSGMPGYFVSKVVGNFEETFLDQIDAVIEWYRERHTFCSIGIIPDNNMVKIQKKLIEIGFLPQTFMHYWIKDISDLDTTEMKFDNIRRIDTGESVVYSEIATEGFNITEESEFYHNFKTFF